MAQNNAQVTTINFNGRQIKIAKTLRKEQNPLWYTLKQKVLFGFESFFFEQPIKFKDLEQYRKHQRHFLTKRQQKGEHNAIREITKDIFNLTEYLSKKSIDSYYKKITQLIVSFENFGDNISKNITKFKKQKILFLDIRIRLILMSVSSAIIYKIISFNTIKVIKRTKNLTFSFLFMGYWVVPEIFNPFLRKSNLASKIM